MPIEKLGLLYSEKYSNQVHRVADFKTFNLVPGWIFLALQKPRYVNLKFCLYKN